MKNWRELSLGEVARGAARYRPFVSAAVALVLVAFVLPIAHREDQAPPTTSAPNAAPPPASASSGGTGQTSLALEGGAAGAATAPGGPGSARTPASSVAAVSAASLSAPDCDARTGRIKVPDVNAPNCVPLWPKGAHNGGATHRGVSATEIVVAIYLPTEHIVRSPQQEQAAEARARDRNRVIDAFQSHFETYGRRVRWVEVYGTPGRPGDAAVERSDAIRVAQEVGAFASIGAPANEINGTNAYVEELAARGVLCIWCGRAQPRAVYERLSPHAWSLDVSLDEAMAHMGEFVGKRLHGRPARWAGDAAMQRAQRRFGFISYDTADGVYADAAKMLRSELARWGARLEEAVQYRWDPDSVAQENARTMVTKLKAAGVTTVILAVDPIMPSFITVEATKQLWFPEWVTTGLAEVDRPEMARTYDQTQWARAFGLGFRTVRIENRPLDFVDWHGGRDGVSPDIEGFGMLYTGIHLAGPRLTPSSFAAGMASFAPVRAGITRYGTSFRDDSGLRHTASSDFTELWWDPNQMGGDGRPGAYRYAEMGRRYQRGEWPTTEARAFDLARSVTRYVNQPPEDRPPSYPYPHAHFRGR